MSNANPAAHETLVTPAHVEYAAKAYSQSQIDPLAPFPALQALAHAACTALGLELALNGTPVALADRAAQRAYHAVILASLTMHRAIWNAVLPDTETAPEK